MRFIHVRAGLESNNRMRFPLLSRGEGSVPPSLSLSLSLSLLLLLLFKRSARSDTRIHARWGERRVKERNKKRARSQRRLRSIFHSRNSAQSPIPPPHPADVPFAGAGRVSARRFRTHPSLLISLIAAALRDGDKRRWNTGLIIGDKRGNRAGGGKEEAPRCDRGALVESRSAQIFAGRLPAGSPGIICRTKRRRRRRRRRRRK